MESSFHKQFFQFVSTNDIKGIHDSFKSNKQALINYEHHADGGNLLISSCYRSTIKIETIKCLINDYHFDPQVKHHKLITILHIYLYSNENPTIEVVEFFVTQCGINPNSLDIYEYTPLMIMCAKEECDMDIFRFLVEIAKTDLNIQGQEREETALMIACYSEYDQPPNVEVVKYLLSRPSTELDLDVRSNCNKTAFMQLCKNEHVTIELIELFISKGASFSEIRKVPRIYYDKITKEKSDRIYFLENQVKRLQTLCETLQEQVDLIPPLPLLDEQGRMIISDSEGMVVIREGGVIYEKAKKDFNSLANSSNHTNPATKKMKF